MNRVNTFRQMFEHLDAVNDPVFIVETGGLEEPDNWDGNGCSTLLFDKYVSCRPPGSMVVSIELDWDKVAAAIRLVSSRTMIVCSDSVGFLRRLNRCPDLLYLDASDIKWDNQGPAQLHHFNELMAAMPCLKPETLVVVDDSPVGADKQIEGKGGLVAKHAQLVGAELVFTEWQSGWKGFHAQS